MVEVAKVEHQTWPRWAAFALLAIGGAGADLWTKEVVFRWRGIPGESEPLWLIENYVGIETAVNLGALFGMGAGFGTFFAVLSVVAAIAILVWLGRFRAIESWWSVIALGCIMGGIVGNLYDRLGFWYQIGYPSEWRSGVRDWILFRYESFTWPNFNIADSLLVCGAIMLAIQSFLPPAADESATGKS